MSLGFKLVKASTWEEWIGMTFMFGKLGSLILFYFEDMVKCVYYGLLCLILWLALMQPKFKGKSKIINSF